MKVLQPLGELVLFIYDDTNVKLILKFFDISNEIKLMLLNLLKLLCGIS